MLDLREGFLYGVEIRRVGRQVDELASPPLDELPYLLRPVSSEVVHHHNLTGPEGRGQQVLYVCFEDSSGGGPFHSHRRSHPSRTKAREQRCVLTAVSRYLEERSLAYGRVGVKRSQGGVGAHLIHEYQPPGIDAPDLHAP